jgi:hypothetical protein
MKFKMENQKYDKEKFEQELDEFRKWSIKNAQETGGIFLEIYRKYSSWKLNEPPFSQDIRKKLALEYMNNFHLNLPNGMYRRHADKWKLQSDLDKIINEDKIPKETFLEGEISIEVLERLYIQMRKLGYNHKDLIV